MNENPALALVAVLALGIAGQWVAWRSKLPSILILLALGFTVGPILGVLRPDETLGELLFPIVSLAASVILFEGGLSASWRQLSQVAEPIRRLVTLGALLTWIGSSLAARAILGLEWGLAIVLGAILVVTGPTVIDPLMRHVRPSGSVGTVAKLEGIITDPIGALIAVLSFQALESGSASAAFGTVAFDLSKGLAAGIGLGAAGAALVAIMLRREWLPHSLAPAMTIAIMLSGFVVANTVQHESGLLTVTLMGILLASISPDDIRDTFEFTENLRTVLIGALFILLSARVELSDIIEVPPTFIGFAAALFLLVRPLAVGLSLLGTDTSWRERVFLAWLAPRGIVAAAIASLFGLELTNAGVKDAELVMPVTVMVVVATVAVYGLSSKSLARLLGLAAPDPHGVLIVGASELGRKLALVLQKAAVRVMLIDSNFGNVSAARVEGLDARHGSATSETFLDELELDLGGIGQLLALTSNPEANALSAAHFRSIFGDRVYQIALQDRVDKRPPVHLRGHYVANGVLHDELERLLYSGWQVKATELTDMFGLGDYRSEYGQRAIELVRIRASGAVELLEETLANAVSGDVVVSLVPTEVATKAATV